MAWSGSLLLHGALVVVALQCRPERAAPVEGAQAVELVAVAPAIAPVPVPEPVPERAQPPVTPLNR